MRELLLYASLPFIFLLGLKKPFWCLVIYLAANILRPEMFFWGGYTGAIIFRVSIGGALLGYLMSGEKVLAPLGRRELWLLIWFWLAVVASITYSEFPLSHKTWYYAEEILKLVIVGWLILGLVKDSYHLRKLMNVLLIVSSLLALWGWDQSFRGNVRLEGLGGQAFGDSNGVAAFGVLFFPLALHKLLTSTERWDRMFGLASTVLIGMLVVFTQSRGGFLGLLAGTGYLFCLTPRKKQMFIGMALLVTLASPFIANSYLVRISTISLDQEKRDLSAGSRPVLWQAGIHIFLDNPIFGVGLLNYKWAKMPYKETLRGKVDDDLLNYTFQEYKVGHSTWFCQLLAEGGLFLTIPYLWLVFGFFFSARRLRRMKIEFDKDLKLLYLLFGLEAGIFGYCVSISFIDALMVIFFPIHLILGMQIIRLLQQGTQPKLASAHKI